MPESPGLGAREELSGVEAASEIASAKLHGAKMSFLSAGVKWRDAGDHVRRGGG